MLKPAAVEKHDKERQAQRRDGAVEEGEVGFGDARVEAKEIAHPEQGQHPARAQPLQGVRGKARAPQRDGQHRQESQQRNVQRAPQSQRQTVVEEQGEVLGPALEHGRRGAVHARGDSVGGVAEPEPNPAPLGQKGQLHVLEHHICNRGVAPQPPVGLPLDQQKLPVGRGEALFGVGDLGRRIGQRQLAEDQRHERPLRQSTHDLTRRVAQHPCVVPGCFVHGPVQIARLVDGVGIGKEQPAPARAAGRGPYSIVLAGPAGFELAGLDQCHSGEAAGNLRGVVGGVIIDDD